MEKQRLHSSQANIFYIVILSFVLLFSNCNSIQAAEGRNPIEEIKIGILLHDVDGLWSGFKREKGTDINCAAIFKVKKRLLGGDLQPVLGASVNTLGYTSKLYLDGVWHYDLTKSLYGTLGLGVALHNGERHLVSSDRKALGSHLLFHLPLEIGYRFDSHLSFSIYFDHMSNGYILEENEGLDTLGFRVGYRF